MMVGFLTQLLTAASMAARTKGGEKTDGLWNGANDKRGLAKQNCKGHARLTQNIVQKLWEESATKSGDTVVVLERRA